WLLSVSGWQEEWVRGYETLQVLWVVVGCFVLQLMMEKYFRIKIIVAMVMCGGLLYCLFAHRTLSHGGVVLVLLYLVIVVAEGTRQRWKKVKGRGTEGYVLWLAGFFGVYLLGMLLMPAPEEAFDWKFVKSAYDEAQEFIQKTVQNIRFRGSAEYSFAYTGFSGEGELGGGVVKTDREQGRELMLLQGDRSLKTNVYLMGCVYDTFEGREWVQENESGEKERYLDTLETMYAVQRYDKRYFRDYLSRVNLKVRYRHFRSGYLFAPLKTWSVEQEKKLLYHKAQGGSLLFGETKGYGMEYQVEFYQMNTGHSAFSELLMAEYAPDEEVLGNLLANTRRKLGEELTMEDVEEHKQLVHACYMGSDGVSEAVGDYLAQITEGAENDVEKLKAIERELSSFSYDQTPGVLPQKVVDGKSFLDYFLLESKRGYCTHFATAFVLLARAEGYPARYVQGFCVPMNGDEQVAVYSDMAHAWPEVYFENVGWIPFEPTPGYAGVRYTPWAVLIREKQQEKGADYSRQEEAMRQSLMEPEEEESPEDTDAQGSVRSALYNTLRILEITLKAIIFFLVGAMLMLWLERVLRKRYYAKQNLMGKYRIEMERSMRFLALLGIVRGDGETLEELGKRAESRLELEQPMTFLADYESVLYGTKDVEQGMLIRVRDEQGVLFKLLKNKRKLMYYYYLIQRS
ncbi:MAG: transglutaminase domain-containing protein, partial [Lachnospiraceae bacterium]|nr:transglutaminase domain-containing protein [Lachnospiraceae bacterium]